MAWIALVLTTTAAALPPDRPTPEVTAVLDGAVLDAADGFVLRADGDAAEVVDPDGATVARLPCGDGPVRGVLDRAHGIVLVAGNGVTCVANGIASLTTRTRTLPGGGTLDARATAAGVVRLRADGSLEGRGPDGARRWRRRAPVGTGRRLRADVDRDVVVVVGDDGVARLDARTGRLIRASFVPGTADGACDATHAWVGARSGQVRRFRLVDGREDTPALLRGHATDGAVRELVPEDGRLAVLRAAPDGAPADAPGRLQVFDLAREALAMDRDVPDDPAARLARVVQATPMLRWSTSGRTELLAWPDLGALPRPLPLREAPMHRPARDGETLPPITAPTTLPGPATATVERGTPPRAVGPRGATAVGHDDGTVALSGERNDDGRWQILYGPVTAVGWGGRAWLVAGDEGEGHVVRAVAPAGEADAELPAPAWHPGPLVWLDADASGVRAGGPEHLAAHDFAGHALLDVRGDWRGATRGATGELRAVDAAGRIHRYTMPTLPLRDSPRTTEVTASPDGARAVTFEGDVPVLHHARTARVLAKLPPLGAAPRAVAVRPAPGAPDLAVWRLDDVLDLVDTQRGEVARSVTLGGPPGDGAPWMAWSTDGRAVWVHLGAPDGPHLSAIDTTDGHVVARIDTPRPGNAGGRWRALPDGRWLDLDAPEAPPAPADARPLRRDDRRGWRWVSVPEGAEARDDTGAPQARLDLDGPALAVAESTDGAWRAGMVAGGTLTVVGTRHGTVAARRRVDPTRCATPSALRWEEDDTVLVVTCDGARPVRLAWRVGHTFGEAPRPPGAVTPVRGRPTLARAPDGTRLAVGLSDGTVRLVSLRDGAQEALLVGHADAVTQLAWEGTRLASASKDGSVRVRDTTTGEELGAASTFGVPLHAVRLTTEPDGAVRVEADGDDGLRRRWTLRGTRWTVHDRSPATAAPPEAPRAPGPVSREARARDDGSVDLHDDDGPVPAAVLRWYSDGAWSVDHADGTRITSTSLGDGTATPLATP